MNTKSKRIKTKTTWNSFFYVGLILTLILFAVVVVSFFWTPFEPTKVSAFEKMNAPSAAHLLGTDHLGRDVLSRIMSGIGTSFLIAVGVVAIGCIFGIIIGSLCGYYGGIPDLILTRICDTITAFPAILLALVIISIIGGGTYNIILVLGILFIPSFARVVRTEFARIRELNYIQSARLMGASNFRIIFFHILPNTIPVLLPAIAIGFNNAVLSESSMSFLGIGVLPPQPSLGSMLKDAQNFLRNAPWCAVSSGCAIALLILAFSLLSEGMMMAQRKK